MRGVAAKSTVGLGRNSSVLLDVVRFGAALAVVLNHLQIFSTRTQMIPGRTGDMAVCVFFVLSGFVIRFVTETRELTLKAYLIDRASRIYSVLLPALLFMLVVEGICVHFFQAGYAAIADTNVWSSVGRDMAAAVTFTLGFWGYGATPLNNIAIWSLPFEVAYYVLYGWMRYKRVARWWLVPLGLVLVGPSIGVLFLVWLMGAWLFDVYRVLIRTRQGVWLAGGIFVGVTGAMVVGRHAILAGLRATDGTARDAWIRHVVASTGIGWRIFHGAAVPWLSRLRFSDFLLSAALFVLLLFCMLVLDRKVPDISQRTERAIRVVADGTFALYCFHLPMLVLVYSVAGHKATSVVGTVVPALVVVVLGVLIARPLDAVKNGMRRGLRRVWV